MFGLFALDRLLKYLIVSEKIALPASNFLLNNNFFSLSLYQNGGLMFSLPLPWPWFMLLIISAIIIILIHFFFAAWRAGQTKTALALLLIIAGAISNLADRLAYGFVIDYLEFFGRVFFNLADFTIAAGVLILITKKANHADQSTIGGGARA